MSRNWMAQFIEHLHQVGVPPFLSQSIFYPLPLIYLSRATVAEW